MGLSYTLACLWLTLKDVPPRHIPSESRQILSEAKSKGVECCLQLTQGLLRARVSGSDLLKRYCTNTGVTRPFCIYPWRWLVKAHTNLECDDWDQSWGEVCSTDVSNSQTVVGEKIWGFTVSRMVHRSVISVKDSLLTRWKSSCMLKLEKFKSIMCYNTTPWFLSLKHPKQTKKPHHLGSQIPCLSTVTQHRYNPIKTES